MSTARLHLILPEQVADFALTGPLREALTETARLAGADLFVENECAGPPSSDVPPLRTDELPIQYRGQTVGRVLYCANGNSPAVLQAAGATASLIEHVLGREMAIEDLASAMTTSYEEINLLHNMLSDIAGRTDAAEIGRLLVEEAARVLCCMRVSLLVCDEARQNLKVLASRGLPLEAHDVWIPTAGSVAGRVFARDGLLIVDDASTRPDLTGMSRGHYQSESFALIRVPLNAHGEAVGVLAATERVGGAEFTTRDQKLFEGLSSIGASALLNCRLHETVTAQMKSTIRALASAVDAKDHYTHDHSGRVAQLCLAIARHLGVTDTQTCREVELAGLLHDIGKIGIPDSILSKADKLTPEEYTVIKSHVQIGARIVENVQGLGGVARAILHHHERHDGLGYPSGLSGKSIPFASKLISAADVFDTLASDRIYRKAIPIAEALRELQRCKGTQQDPAVVDALVAVINREGELSTVRQDACRTA